uniref:Major sperm protein n=1 Tax=Rhabditophanes sp. KR3021 TaxID=114890 RepID=A0AC35UGR6_9BILA
MPFYENGETITIFNTKDVKQRATIKFVADDNVAVAKRDKKNFAIPYDIDIPVVTGKKKSKKAKELQMVMKFHSQTFDICGNNKNAAKAGNTTIGEFIESTLGDEWSLTTPPSKGKREEIIEAIDTLMKQSEGKMVVLDDTIDITWVLRNKFPEALKNLSSHHKNSLVIDVSNCEPNKQNVQIMFKQPNRVVEIQSLSFKDAPQLLTTEFMEFRDNLSVKYRHAIIIDEQLSFFRLHLIKDKLLETEEQLRKASCKRNGKICEKFIVPIYFDGIIETANEIKVDCVQNRLLRLKRSALSCTPTNKLDRPLSFLRQDEDITVVKLGNDYYKAKENANPLPRKPLIKPLRVDSKWLELKPITIKPLRVVTSQTEPIRINEAQKAFASSPTNSIDSGVGSPNTPLSDETNSPFNMRPRSVSESVCASCFKIDGHTVCLYENEPPKPTKSILKKGEQCYTPKYQLKHTVSNDHPLKCSRKPVFSRSISECNSNYSIYESVDKNLNSTMSFDTIFSEDDESSYEETAHEDEVVDSPRCRRKTISFSEENVTFEFNERFSIVHQNIVNQKKRRNRRKHTKSESCQEYTTIMEQEKIVNCQSD